MSFLFKKKDSKEAAETPRTSSRTAARRDMVPGSPAVASSSANMDAKAAALASIFPAPPPSSTGGTVSEIPYYAPAIGASPLPGHRRAPSTVTSGLPPYPASGSGSYATIGGSASGSRPGHRRTPSAITTSAVASPAPAHRRAPSAIIPPSHSRGPSLVPAAAETPTYGDSACFVSASDSVAAALPPVDAAGLVAVEQAPSAGTAAPPAQHAAQGSLPAAAAAGPAAGGGRPASTSVGSAATVGAVSVCGTVAGAAAAGGGDCVSVAGVTVAGSAVGGSATAADAAAAGGVVPVPAPAAAARGDGEGVADDDDDAPPPPPPDDDDTDDEMGDSAPKPAVSDSRRAFFLPANPASQPLVAVVPPVYVPAPGEDDEEEEQGAVQSIVMSPRSAAMAAAAMAANTGTINDLLELRTHFSAISSLGTKYFSLGQTLGTGTFGRVVLVRYNFRGTLRYFALKVLKKTEILRLQQVDHIKAEKSILSRLAHPFIVSLYATFADTRSLYMLMEFVVGGELFSQLRKASRFANDTARFYAAEITLAFTYLHARDVAYRDLKPENLLIDKDGHVKMADFGFAKVVPDRTWTLCGTPEYLAPEIIQSKGHGKPVDWWALGILIFEMLAGYPPFHDDVPFNIYQKVLAGRVEFPKHFDANAKDLVRKLLVADRSRRLGCLRGGSEDVKTHRWFKGLDWAKCAGRKLKPPFVPDAKAAGDTSNFAKYPEPSKTKDAKLTAKEQALFDDF